MTTSAPSFSTHLPEWVRFFEDYVSPEIPVSIVVRTTPSLQVFADNRPLRIGVRFALSGQFNAALANVLTEIQIEVVHQDGHRYVEMWTDSHPLFRSFYSLVLEIIDDVVVNGAQPLNAIGAAVGRWDQLLSSSTVMSEEKQTGLFGELWLLERFIKSIGADALNSWVGPIPETHDFRTTKAEFEVKTTTGAERRHTINTLGQLTPSVNFPLFLLSIQLTSGGTGGQTLPEFINQIKSLLGGTPEAVERFEALLAAVGYENADRDRYGARRKLRTEPTLIPVVDGTPRLTNEALLSIPSVFSPERISNVVYQVDVSGLGYADGSSFFLDLIPNG